LLSTVVIASNSVEIDPLVMKGMNQGVHERDLDRRTSENGLNFLTPEKGIPILSIRTCIRSAPGLLGGALVPALIVGLYFLLFH
jgi:hypothetical protein